MMQKLFACLILLFSCTAMPFAQGRTQSADLVVYGATASGVMTAYTAARQGLNVVLLEPGSHVGGMVTGGLSATDVAYCPFIGGYAREFYKRQPSTTAFIPLRSTRTGLVSRTSAKRSSIAGSKKPA